MEQTERERERGGGGGGQTDRQKGEERERDRETFRGRDIQRANGGQTGTKTTGCQRISYTKKQND